jgi:uncharacterized lipoprotein YmbA
MKTILIAILITTLAGCSTTMKTEYIELPPVVKKEYVYIKCKIPAELLTTNDIVINKEKAILILKKIALETNDRKRKIEAIRSIECIEGV